MKSRLIGKACIAALPLIVLACRIVYVDFTKESSALTVQSFRLRDGDVSGWSEDNAQPFAVYVGSELAGPINGGAYKYLDQGMLETSIQYMKTPEGKTLTAFVMDFGTPEKATVMFGEAKAALTDMAPSPSFPEDIAVVDRSQISGCMGFAHFGSFYFELSLDGYDDQDQSVQAADLFFKVYQKKSR